MMKKTSWILFSFSALMSGVALAKEVAVVVAAHPDDLVSCAGAALLLSEKYELHLVDTTHGERGLGEEGYRDGSCRALRIKEEEKACSLVGAKLHWLEEVDGEASAGTETIMKFEELFKTLRPRVVLMPWPVNSHCDHTMAMAAAWGGLARAGLRTPGMRYEPEAAKPTEVYFYEQTTQTRSFRPTTFVDITSVKARKDAVIQCYACQTPEMLKEQRTADAVFWGRRIGVEYAEAYVACDGLVDGNGVFSRMGVQR